MNSDNPTLRRVELRVRTRLTVESATEEWTARTVHCPRRDATATVKECLLCPRCEQLKGDDDHAYVVCLHQEGPPEAARRRRTRPTSQAEHTPVSTVMTAHVTCVSPDLAIETLASLLVERGMSGVPVVDESGRAIGVVSKSDLVRRQLESGAPESRGRVRDIMMPIAFTMPEGVSISHAAALMAYECIHRVPIVAADGTVIGIVSALDILRWLADQDGYVVGRTP